ncbi:glycosyltransferase [Leeuwenhoekiella aequorea]|uniref:Glycosyltransferase involved in cell wall biosynthesis n=1 Tax=Leeuwenhoekiella aequorea TaxID=283736 RepID=A0A4Q0P395_9FLAO|nr:glycosyltransferase [Leeuwenhoekiella aequorea]RXG20446.1 glycosyltransferase involved in cell wall biosynthesis [Leeuwenhoekiella aequorea]
MENKVCCIFNYPPHYREAIFLIMEQELGCDFYFGDVEEGKIKPIDYNLFEGNPKKLETIKVIGNFIILKKSIRKSFAPYESYILTGDPFIISVWVMLIINYITGKKTYLWCHGWYGRENLVKKILKKVFFRLSTGVLLYGNYARDLMIEEGLKANKLHVIYNSLDYFNQIQFRDSAPSTSIEDINFKDKAPVIIFTGRLTKIKNIDLLLEAQEILVKRGIIVNSLIIGDGPECKGLKKLVTELNLEDNCHFFGACYEESVLASLYKLADVCVSPGNVGLTAIHAMTYGCPVITHDNFPNQMPEFEAIKEGLTGMFFKYQNSTDLASKIEKWLSLSNGKEEIIRNSCYAQIDNYFNPERQISIIKSVIQSE